MKDQKIKKTIKDQKMEFLNQRLVFLANATPTQSPRENRNQEETTETVPNVDIFENKVNMVRNYDENLLSLAKNNQILKENFKKAIEESLREYGVEQTPNSFWEEVFQREEKNNPQVEVKKGKIRIFKIENGNEIDLAPNQHVVPIKIEVPLIKPEINSEYLIENNYEYSNGIITGNYLKLPKEPINNLFKYVKEGDEFLYKHPSNNIEQTVVIKKENNKFVLRNKNNNAKAVLYTGSTIKPLEPRRTINSEHFESIELEKHTIIGTTKRQTGESLDNYLKIMLGEIENPENDYNINFHQNGENLHTKLKEFKRKHDYTRKEYYDFLKTNNAFRPDGTIFFLFPEEEFEKREKNSNEKTLNETAQTRRQNRSIDRNLSRNSHYQRENVRNALNNSRINNLDSSLIELVKDKEKWEIAWKSNSIENLQTLKRVIREEIESGSSLFRNTNPDAYMEKVRLAIAAGKNNNIKFSDIFIHIFNNFSAPSRAMVANEQNLNMFINHNNFELNDRFESSKITNNFLTALGPEAKNSAKLLATNETGTRICFTYNNHIYVTTINNRGKVEISTLNGNYDRIEYPKGRGYKNSINIPVRISENEIIQRQIRSDFENAVTPTLTFPQFRRNLQSYYDNDGNERPGVVIPKAYQDAIIAGNRMLFAMEGMKYEQKSTEEMAVLNVTRRKKRNNKEKLRAKNVKAENANENLSALVNDKNEWKKQWKETIEYNGINVAYPTLEKLYKACSINPILNNQNKKDLGERIRLAILNGKNNKLSANSIFKHILSETESPFNPGEKLGDERNFRKFMRQYNKNFDTQGNPKNPMDQEKARKCKEIIEAINLLMRAFEDKELLSERELSIANQDLQYLRQRVHETVEYNREETYFYKLAELTKSPARISKKPQDNFDQVGIAVSKSALEKLDAFNKNQNCGEKALLLLFDIYSVEDLVSQNCIKKANEVNEYIITRLPDRFVKYLNQIKTGTNNESQLEWLTNNNSRIIRQKTKEQLNPRLKIERIANILFPPNRSKTTYENIATNAKSKQSDELLYDYMDAAIANSIFKEICEGKNENQISEIIKNYVISGYESLENHYPKDPSSEAKSQRRNSRNGRKRAYQDFEARRNKFNQSSTAPFVINADNLEERMRNPEFQKMVRLGFLNEQNNSLDEENAEKTKKMKELLDTWMESLTEEDKAQFKQALEKSGVPKEEVDAVMMKTLPVYFGAGLDLSENKFGIGVGIGIPVPIEHNGRNYGTIYPGGGVGVGINLQNGTPSIGPGIGIGYQTPKLGRFSVVVGAAAGAGVNASGRINTGVGAGIGVPISLRRKRKKGPITLTPGVAYAGGLIIPGITMSFSRNHEVKTQNLIDLAFEEYGINETEKKLDQNRNATDEMRKNIIGENPELVRILVGKNQKAFNSLEASKVINDYDEFKLNLANRITENYNPKKRRDWTFGIGVDSKGNIIIGAGVASPGNRERMVTRQEGKSGERMIQDTQVSQVLEMERQIKAGNNISENVRQEHERRKIELGKSGKIIIDANGEMSILTEKPEQRENTESNSAETNTEPKSIQEKETKINEILKNLNLAVKYDEGQRMFELLIKDSADAMKETNYDIVADPRMTNGGIVFSNGRVYLSGNFTTKNAPPTLLRSDYVYPFRTQGAKLHSIITFSDSPRSGAHEIYTDASKTIRSERGGTWFEAIGPGTKPPKILTGNQIIRLENETTNNETQIQNSENFTNNFNQISKNENDFGILDDNQISQANEFAEKIVNSHRHGFNYRLLSNAETNSKQYEKLTKIIKEEWKKEYDTEITDREINLVRTLLVHHSASENRHTNPVLRQNEFMRRLNTTKETLKKEYGALIRENHRKYPVGDPRRIRRTADEIINHATERAKSINVNDYDTQNTRELKNIDRFVYVTGSMGVKGLRGETYNLDAKNNDHSMIGVSDNYINFLAIQPESIDADLARIIIEQISPEAYLKENPSFAEVKSFLGNELTRKIASTLEHPKSAEIFSNPQIRDTVIRLIATRNNLNHITEEEIIAVKEFGDLISEIRNAQINGQRYYFIPGKESFRYEINGVEIHDGVYKECTNYSMWMNENFTLEHVDNIRPSERFAFYAAGGDSRARVAPASSQVWTVLNYAGVAKAPTAPRGGIAGPRNTIATGSGDTKVEESVGEIATSGQEAMPETTTNKVPQEIPQSGNQSINTSTPTSTTNNASNLPKEVNTDNLSNNTNL